MEQRRIGVDKCVPPPNVLDQHESTDSLTFLAKIMEQAERYDDMAKAMKKVIEKERKLNSENRNLFSVAYKNVVGARRSSWRVICMIEQKAENDKHADLTKVMRKRVENELAETCGEVLYLLDILIDAEKCSKEEQVFYWKMKGDYCRYKAEYEPNDDDEASSKCQANRAYEKAMTIAVPKKRREKGEGCNDDTEIPEEQEMKPTHPNRLGLALNYSVFFYEILNEPVKACELAKQAFDDAISELDNMKEPDCKDSTLIMQLLRDNLTLWTSDTSADIGGEQQD